MGMKKMIKANEQVKVRELTQLGDVERVLADSKNKPVFVFKHSDICPISHNALEEYWRFVKHYDGDNFDYTLIRIRSHRDISNAVAEKTGVKHESPQVLLLVEGKSVWDDSHFEITAEKLRQVVMMYEDGDFRD